MALQNADTTTVQGTAIAEEAVAVHHSGQPTPAQVLSWLPKDATPAHSAGHDLPGEAPQPGGPAGSDGLQRTDLC